MKQGSKLEYFGHDKSQTLQVQLTTRQTDFLVVGKMSVDLVGSVKLVDVGYGLLRLQWTFCWCQKLRKRLLLWWQLHRKCQPPVAPQFVLIYRDLSRNRDTLFKQQRVTFERVLESRSQSGTRPSLDFCKKKSTLLDLKTGKSDRGSSSPRWS